MSILEQIERMESALTTIRNDAIKFDQGNNAAGTRVRKAMMEIKIAAQEVREEVSAVKSAR